jgi:hypothetical protein
MPKLGSKAPDFSLREVATGEQVSLSSFDGKDALLVYRGQLDDSRPGNGAPIDGRDLRGAIEALLKGDNIAEDQKPSIGCNIKWRPGNEPSYFG